MLNDPPNINALWSALIVEELVRNGVDTYCVAPGSRSAPLAMAVATGGPLTSVVHFDERGAAFHALGHAKATGRPSAFVCTSGTAAANAYPAVIEASLAHVPLIIITADRPPELQDTGANQTIDQAKLFGGYVRWFHHVPCPDERIPPESVLTAVDQAVYCATRPPAGPVHLNCSFREPLAPDRLPFDSRTYTRSLASWFDGPYTRYERPEFAHNDRALAAILQLLAQNRRGLLLVGQLNSPSDIAALSRLAELLQWPVFADVASGLRLGPLGGNPIDYYDALLRSRAAELVAAAQVILHIGGPMVSKELLRFFEATPSRIYIRVADHGLRHDPAHRISHRLEIGLPAFADAIAAADIAGVDEGWVERLTQASAVVASLLDERYSDDDAISEISAPRVLSASAPPGSVLYLGNSMPIRDADAILPRGPHRLRVAANRGASGIDGNIATAAGYGAALRCPVTAIIGDLAALHDASSLALLRHNPAPVVLIVINNDGGGIFSFLPIAEHAKHFERFFGTPHGLGFEGLATAFGLRYAHPQTNAELRRRYEEALASGKSTIIEITTDRRENESLHRRLRNEMQTLLNSSQQGA